MNAATDVETWQDCMGFDKAEVGATISSDAPVPRRIVSARWGDGENGRKGLMADSENRVSSAGDAIPMKKTGVTTYLAIAGAVVAVGVVALVTSGKSDAEAEQKAAAAIKAATAKKSTSSMSAEEQREHMKMTARAFERAEADAAAKAAEAQQQKAAAAEAQTQAQAAANATPAAPAEGGAAPPPKPKVSGQAAKKQIDSLDSMGSDIASALE